jgi:hypothetical protein
MGLIFPLTYMCTQHLYHIHPPTPFPYLLPLPTVTNPCPRQDLFYPPVLWFCKRKKKKRHFCLFKIAQGVSLWHVHVCMHYNPNWFISSVFLLSTLVHFLCWFQQVKNSIFIFVQEVQSETVLDHHLLLRHYEHKTSKVTARRATGSKLVFMPRNK